AMSTTPIVSKGTRVSARILTPTCELFAGTKPKLFRVLELWDGPWVVKLSAQPHQDGHYKSFKDPGERAQRIREVFIHEFGTDWMAIRDNQAAPCRVVGSVRRKNVTLVKFNSAATLLWDEDFPKNKGGPEKRNREILDNVA